MTLITYDTFSPGTLLGEWEETLDSSLPLSWIQLFGTAPVDAPAQQAGLAVILMIRAYLNVVTPRPPGNVHAKQVFTLERLPKPGDTVCSHIRCLSKEIRRERRYVELGAIGTGDDGHTIYTGRMSLIWAA